VGVGFGAIVKEIANRFWKNCLEFYLGEIGATPIFALPKTDYKEYLFTIFEGRSGSSAGRAIHF
jgi:hypothetical protein